MRSRAAASPCSALLRAFSSNRYRKDRILEKVGSLEGLDYNRRINDVVEEDRDEDDEERQFAEFDRGSSSSSSSSSSSPRHTYYSKFGTTLEDSPSLVLNADFTPLSQRPLSLWHWRDVLRIVYSGRATVVSEYSTPPMLIRGVSLSFRLPSVIALNKYQHIPNKTPMITRRNVFIRDGYRCCYCGEEKKADELTLDHIMPRSRGGKLTWINTVCACAQCNQKKRNAHPAELHKIGMRLRVRPRVPSFNELQSKQVRVN